MQVELKQGSSKFVTVDEEKLEQDAIRFVSSREKFEPGCISSRPSGKSLNRVPVGLWILVLA